MVSHTITALQRWSCGTRDLPAVSQIKALHVYDFDNTLFKSPLPNQMLWTTSAIGFLQSQDTFASGGWWHDQHILEATGGGLEKEEPLAWQGWWNEHIVNLVELSMEQSDALTVLLTGRGEKNFADIINRMVTSPNNQIFASTMKYKQALLTDLMYTYKDADEIRIYEDRPGHTRAFREFLEDFNRISAPTPRQLITAEVIQVAELMTTLDPVTETAEVQRMINSHNEAVGGGSGTNSRNLEIKKTVLFNCYLISSTDTANLLTLINPPSDIGVALLGNYLLISSQTCSNFVLNKIGGIGSKQTWQVTGTGNFESRVWAARVAPVPPNSNIHVDGPVPLVILAHLKNAKPREAYKIQSWQPVSQEKQYIFQTEVGESVQLGIGRIGSEGIEDRVGQYSHRNLKRRHSGLEDSPQERDSYHRNMQNAMQAPTQHQRGRNQEFNESRRPNGGGNHVNTYKGGNQNRGRGGAGPGNQTGGQHRHQQHGGGGGGRGGSRGGGGGGTRGGGGGGGGGNKGRVRGGYKSLDDVGGGRYGGGGQGGGFQNQQRQDPNYDDYVPQHGGDAYNASFPALGAGGPGGAVRDYGGGGSGVGGGGGGGMNQDENYPSWGK